MVYYTVYKITNTVNQKSYIGAHKTNNLDDDYLGSGIAITRAVKKYGRDAFKKEILEILPTEKEMYEREKQLVTLHEMSYNMTLGGKGGFAHIDTRGDNNVMRKNPQAKEKVRHALKNIRKNKQVKERLDEISRTNIKKAIEHNTGKKRPEHADFMTEWSKTYWAANKEKMRDSLSSTFELISPNGEIYVTNRLFDLCESLGLPKTSVWKTSTTGTPPTKGKAKGWLCKRIK